MAVRTYWPEVVIGLHHVVRTNLRHRNKMVNVNESIRYLAVSGKEIEAAR